MGDVLKLFLSILAAIYVLFLPGFVLSFLFFKRSDKSVDSIERLALSFALSIAAVPLIAFYFNLVGVKISAWSVILEVLGIIVLSLVGIWLKNKRRVRHHAKNQRN